MIEPKNIKVMPVKQFCLLLKEGKVKDSAAIIISSYNVDDSKINCIKHVTLNFDDIRKEDKAGFNLDNARIIHRFVDEIKNQDNDLYVCCDSGVSRSSAIAAATYRYLKYNDMDIWKNCKFNPNPYVYKLMCKEYGIRVSKIRLKYNSYINSTSLKRKIKKARK